MLIPNKHNGYRRDGTRNLYIGGGVGEAALLNAMMTGAAVGGGTSIIQGKDPLQGALLGGLMGGAGAGVSSMLGGGASAASGAMPGAAATPAATSAGTQSLAATASSATPGLSASTVPGYMGPVDYSLSSATPSASTGISGLTKPGTMPGFDISGGPANQMGLSAPSGALSQAAKGSTGVMDGASKWWSGLSDKQKLLAGGAGIAGIGMVSDQLRGGIKKKKDYDGPLSRFKYDPDLYKPYFASGGQTGGIASLGSYSDGGRMLKGPGDGMSDNIPANIGGKQPARLADGEFVVPADVVSHLGNGSTDAGAKQLYAMMNKVRKARTGNPKQGRQISAGKYLPA
jgi:hypothetical protein